MTVENTEEIGWAIVELMGHRRVGGHVTEVELAGSKMLRVDIPQTPPATQFYGGSAIYCITPVNEEVARALASRDSVQPVQRWELPAPEREDEDVADAQLAEDGIGY